MSAPTEPALSINERLLNPLTMALCCGLMGYVGICIVLASLSGASSREFLEYVSLLAYPAEILRSTYELHLEFLDDPRGRVKWQWFHAVCALLCIGLPANVLGSVLFTGAARRSCIVFGLVLCVVWMLGALIIFLMSGLH